MKKTLLICVAALLLATGTAHATSFYITVCGDTLVYILGHHDYSYYQIINNEQRELPSKFFTERGSRLYFRGRKCQPLTMLKDAPQLSSDPCAVPVEPGKCGYPK